jgi:hypothetical protein
VWLQDHLLAVKARLHTSLEAAVDEEHEDGNKRLQAKQASAGNDRQPERINSKLCSQGSNQLQHIATGWPAMWLQHIQQSAAAVATARSACQPQSNYWLSVG